MATRLGLKLTLLPSEQHGRWGRAIEITPEGKRAWEFVSPHRAGRRGELIATLFDLVRYPISELTFLETEILDGAPE